MKDTTIKRINNMINYDKEVEERDKERIKLKEEAGLKVHYKGKEIADELNIDKAVDELIGLKGMFNAVVYLMNPDGDRAGRETENIEDWFQSIAIRLDGVIESLGQADKAAMNF